MSTTLTERPAHSTLFDGLSRYIPIGATVALLVAMYLGGLANYNNFDNPQLIPDLFIGNAGLLIIAVGMTFVILSGGIDLSVGSMMAFSTMALAWMTVDLGMPAEIAVPVVLVFGTLSGTFTGAVIHYFDVQPFIATLAGLFLYRGLTLQISDRDVSMRDVEFFSWGMERIEFGSPREGGFSLPYISFIAFAVVVIAFIVLHYTRFGRGVYAVGGSEQSALLMGLPVVRTKVGVYAISGFCASLGGVVAAFYTKSANPLAGVGLELDAIAAVVVGGTLLTGGAGFVLGTVAGVMVMGLLSTIIAFQGNLSSWWARIVVGILLLAFILLQRVLARSGEKRKA
ncbi:sugar ABC transporter permease YjfF [Glycomyces sp. L485]|uniref:galactofuranose ABC transporter, permease protein YjfF n=1 Tax=Glycomyces sp. L485 TaxID=2909235 RepID=UPI001F4BBE7A|nr:galactofuranose ABC transporter, permease protein YjfF [Glycomyces sp. L485]MCH7230640.1 sugar ABC transporter permease YjfF [Glycomyces sp. L485]